MTFVALSAIATLLCAAAYGGDFFHDAETLILGKTASRQLILRCATGASPPTILPSSTNDIYVQCP
jgi:hypothetical protein